MTTAVDRFGADRAPAVRSVTTVGIHGHSLESFLARLATEDVVTVFDVRQRRGVRGAEYAWANAQRLQRVLADAGIGYRRHRALAPTTELRRVQDTADRRAGVGTRSRRRLDPEYRRRYVEEILDAVDLRAVVATMPTKGTTALLCVEADPGACHRSLVAARLAGHPDVRVRRPADAAPAPPHATPWPVEHVPTPFEQEVIDAVGSTEPGDLVTYGDLAVELGHPGAGQAVANVLRHATGVPWWRVVPADGRLYRSHAPTQRPLLEAEGHVVDDHRRVHTSE